MAASRRKKTISTKTKAVEQDSGFNVWPKPAKSLGGFFDLCDGILSKDTELWFRGHADIEWSLIPSALRYDTQDRRNRALALLADFKRYAKTKLTNLPERDEELEWIQQAQHYGLPTRLLDWTRSANIALYFACLESPKKKHADGGVIMLNPMDLNRQATKEHRIFDAYTDADRINKYFSTPTRQIQKACPTIAINPVWDSPRITLQQGAFTLHGPEGYMLTSKQAPSLMCLRIPATRKSAILDELERAGINEMSIFPEPEHLCRYLIWRGKLDIQGAN